MRLANRPTGSLPAYPSNDFDAFVSRVFGHDLGGAPTRYAVDVREDNDHLYIEAELPGFTREQVDVTVDNDVLTITAERPAVSDAEGITWHLRERRSGRLERAFKLPNTLDPSSVDAKLTDGILHVSMKKRQEAKPRKITIA